MAHIKVLSEQVANMIAAGEVIERPASVVKELVENSIDAGSSEIEIKIVGGGIKSIEVIDDGCGMEKEDILLAFTRHATSKIISSSDLFNIQTLGFRGEALPSVASVSKLKLSSSTGDKEGYEATIVNSKVEEIKPFMQRKGTIIKVENLFFNTPARLKHLKSENTEASYILEIVNKLALGYPSIKFSLFNEDRLVFKTSGRGNLLEVISDVYGYNTSKNMIEVNFENDEFKVYGYISNLSVTKSSRKYMTFLINNRNVKMNYVVNALKDAYLNFLEMDKYPLVVLNIEVDNKLVDINVHPSKNEVRLSDEFELCKLVKNNVREKLMGSDIIKRVYNPKEYEQEEMKFDLPNSFGTQKETGPFYTYSNPNNVNHETLNDSNFNSRSVEEPIFSESSYVPSFESNKYNENDNSQTNYISNQNELKQSEQTDISTNLDPLFRIVGQIHKTYIVVEIKDGFFIIDQHAAMERVNFERFEDLMTREKKLTSLLVPLVIELNYKDVMLLKDKLDIFLEFGLELEIFGNNGLRVNKVPVWMTNYDIESYVNEMIEQVLESKTIDLVKLRNHAIATAACKASLKANKSLNEQEMAELITLLFKCKNKNTCPHGRPTMIFYTNYELEHLFKRA